jgi:hypothetical protein
VNLRLGRWGASKMLEEIPSKAAGPQEHSDGDRRPRGTHCRPRSSARRLRGVSCQLSIFLGFPSACLSALEFRSCGEPHSRNVLEVETLVSPILRDLLSDYSLGIIVRLMGFRLGIPDAMVAPDSVMALPRGFFAFRKGLPSLLVELMARLLHVHSILPPAYEVAVLAGSPQCHHGHAIIMSIVGKRVNLQEERQPRSLSGPGRRER